MNIRSREEMESGQYPVRESEPDCKYYIRTGLCRFGATCRFNHPTNRSQVRTTDINLHDLEIFRACKDVYVSTHD